MWLGDKAARSGIPGDSPADLGDVTIGGENPAVNTESEHRDLCTVAPGGYFWLPETGTEALIVNCGDGSRVLAGCTVSGVPENMSPGEVYIKSKGTSVLMKNNGHIIISGDIGITGNISIAGQVDIIGGLMVNGRVI